MSDVMSDLMSEAIIEKSETPKYKNKLSDNSSSDIWVSAEELIQAIRQGEMVVLVDDEDRENEGDLVMAAHFVTPWHINFMAQHGRGLICLPISEERSRQLRLPLMVERNNAPLQTKFTVSIEARHGVTTGISCEDRARTIQAAISAQARPEDIVMPGHVFPLIAEPGGVLVRAGHTEAACDLAMLAGLEPAGVIVEILNEDGTMARRPALEVFAKQHGLKMGSIASLIDYRLLHEQSIKQVHEQDVVTEFGTFRLHMYKDLHSDAIHTALVHGCVSPEEPTAVRVHAPCPAQDLLSLKLGSSENKNECRWSLDKSLSYISKQESGVLICLGNYPSSEMLLQRLQAVGDFNAETTGESSASRSVGIGGQILRDLNVGKMRLLSRKARYVALSGFNLEITEYIEPSNFMS